MVSPLITVGAAYGAWCVLETSLLTLDRDAGTFVIDNRRPFSVPDLVTGQLNDIANATLETNRGAYLLSIVLQSGQRIGLGALVDQGKKSEAVAGPKSLAEGSAE
jgi:hypothetical protein